MATVIFEDTFTEASEVNLDAHTPAPTGTGWTESFNDTSAQTVVVKHVNDFIEPSGAEDSRKMVYTADDAPSIASYDIEVTLRARDGAGDDNVGGVLGRYADINNSYGVALFNSNSATDIKIMKRQSTNTELASGDYGSFSNNAGKFEIRDATKKFYIDTVEQLSTSDNGITAAGKAGVWYGDVYNSGWDIGSVELDNFKITEQPAAASSDYFQNTEEALTGGLLNMDGGLQ